MSRLCFISQLPILLSNTGFKHYLLGLNAICKYLSFLFYIFHNAIN